MSERCLRSRYVGENPAPVISTDGGAIVLDLSPTGRLQGEDISGVGAARLSSLIDGAMTKAETDCAFGRYAEPRELYRGALFSDQDSGEHRTVHMGLDVFCAADTPVHAPLDGVVEFTANNARELDYGPVLILRHTDSSGDPFFTLYGHLNLATLDKIEAGQPVSAGQRIAWVGRPPHNGNWPPHLHFQLILDLLGLGADFPGVAFDSQREYWLSLSPSPAGFFPDYDPGSLEYSPTRQNRLVRNAG